MYENNKTSYNMNIKHKIKISIFATFQQPYPSHLPLWEKTPSFYLLPPWT